MSKQFNPPSLAAKIFDELDLDQFDFDIAPTAPADTAPVPDTITSRDKRHNNCETTLATVYRREGNGLWAMGISGPAGFRGDFCTPEEAIAGALDIMQRGPYKQDDLMDWYAVPGESTLHRTMPDGTKVELRRVTGGKWVVMTYLCTAQGWFDSAEAAMAAFDSRA